MMYKDDESIVISTEIKRLIVSYLLAQSVAFSVEPLPERRYLIRVAASILPGLQTEIEKVLARGLVDDDDNMAWFRYKGALISYVEWKPGYTAEYHYRYETANMGGSKKFDIRDIETFVEGNNHEAVIRDALDCGILHPQATFLQEPGYERWECS